MSFRLEPITREEHLRFVTARPSVSHLQVPSWGDVKPDWRAESLGWFDEGGKLVGAGLVLSSAARCATMRYSSSRMTFRVSFPLRALRRVAHGDEPQPVAGEVGGEGAGGVLVHGTQER
ncbi:hypothetical protein STENM223S_10620 [Streptomyces tendae]